MFSPVHNEFQHVLDNRFYGYDCHLETPDHWVLEEVEAPFTEMKICTFSRQRNWKNEERYDERAYIVPCPSTAR
jgi:hypothetical protein